MPKYSMPFIAKIHRFLRVCLEINQLEINKVTNQNYTYNYAQDSCEIYYNSPNNYKIEIEKLNHTSDVLLRYIYKKSVEENYYFFDCPAEVYINHYENRKRRFLNNYIDSNESDFVNAEIKNLENPKQYQIITIKYKCINKFLAKKNKEFINFNHLRASKNSNSNIIEFKQKSAIINYTQLIKTNDTWKYSHRNKIKFLKLKLVEIKENSLSQLPEKSEDLNSKQLSTNQIVILFDKVGIFSLPAFDSAYKAQLNTLLSDVLNKNSSKIKKSIRKLENTTVTKNYQDDIDKVDQLLMNLKK